MLLSCCAGIGRGRGRRTSARRPAPARRRRGTARRSRGPGAAAAATKPKQRIPSAWNDLASVPPESMYGTHARVRVLRAAAPRSSRRRAHRRTWSRTAGRSVTHSRVTSGPISSSSSRSNASSPARQDPAVDHRLGGRRDHVGLVPGLEHRRVRRVAHRRADDPRRSARASRSSPRGRRRAKSQPGLLADRRRGTRATGSVRTSGNWWLPSRATASASVVTALSSWTNEPWPARARGPSAASTRMPFSAVSIEVEALVAAVRCGTVSENPPTSPIASVTPSNRSGRFSTSHFAPYLPPASSSATNANTRSRGGTMPGALEVPGDRERHADHVLHVDRAAAPHVPVLRRHRRTGARTSRAASAGTTSRWPCTQQRAPARIGARQPREDVAAARRAGLDVLASRSRPLRASRPPTRRAFRLAPRWSSSSPVLEVSNRISALTRSTTSSRGRWRSRSSSRSPFVPSAPPRSRGLGRAYADPLALGALMSEWRNGRRASLRC